MRVAHVIQSIDPRFGGPSAVVMRLARAQANLGADVSVVTASSADERRCFHDWLAGLGPSARIDLVPWPGGWHRNLRADRQPRELFERHDIVHAHGVWDALVSRCLAARGRTGGGARLMLAPHGMLSHWSMRQKKLKKALAWKLWLGSALARVDRFLLLNDGEGRDLRALLPHASIGVLPNGTDLPEGRGDLPRPGRKYILFLARLHPVKGPDRLVDAFAHGVHSGAIPADFDLVMAGPDFGSQDELRGRVARLGIAARVKFPGAVFGAEKEGLLGGAAALCQPSRHEGFSVTLLEALAQGVPVITTPESNLPANLAADGALVVAGDDVGALASALGRMALDGELRGRMGHAGKALVARHYTWQRIAELALQQYARCVAIEDRAKHADRLTATRTG